MGTKTASLKQSRRQFLSEIPLAGTLCCFGCSTCFDSSQPEKKHKFLEHSGMTFKQVYDFAYKEWLIPLFQNLANDIGKDKLIVMLKKARSEMAKQSALNVRQNLPNNDLTAFSTWEKESNLNRFWKHVLTFDIVEDTDKAFGIKVTECLFSETFREANASDIGYAALCHGDYAYARAFNPNIRMIRPKTLMQGHDCCNLRWIMEG